MRSAKRTHKKKVVSPLIALAVIAVALVVVVAIGYSAARPKGDPFVPRGNKTVYQQRETNARIWREEQEKAKREGRQPNYDLEPVPSLGTAETRGSLRAKGFGPAMQHAPGAPTRGN